MDSLKKMVLVEPRVLEILKEKKHEQSLLLNAVSSLDAEMNAFISRSDLTDADKVRLYDQVLQRYNVYREKLISPPNKDEVEKKKHFDESEIFSNVPSSYKQKTKQLLRQIKNNSSIGWNDIGEFVYAEQAVPDSNIKELIAATVRQNKSTELCGWNEFKKALKDFNLGGFNQTPKVKKTHLRPRVTKWEVLK